MAHLKPIRLRPFLLEVAIYAVLVVGYFFAVLLYLDDWLVGLFEQSRVTYAFVALGLIVGQGFLLESLTSVLVRLTRARRR
jgi:hypothetical protein